MLAIEFIGDKEYAVFVESADDQYALEITIADGTKKWHKTLDPSMKPNSHKKDDDKAYMEMLTYALLFENYRGATDSMNIGDGLNSNGHSNGNSNGATRNRFEYNAAHDPTGDLIFKIQEWDKVLDAKKLLLHVRLAKAPDVPDSEMNLLKRIAASIRFVCVRERVKVDDH
jgi:hypothetical protein